MQETAQILSSINKLIIEVEALKDSIKNNNINSSRSNEMKDLFGALAKAQSEMQPAALTRENPYFKNKFADLTEVIKASRQALSKNGLSVIQQIMPNDDGQNIIHTILCHSSGQWIESKMRIIPPKNDIQTLTSYINNIARIAYERLICNSLEGDDDDGERAMVDTREMIAKGPSIKYDPKEQSFDVITKEQLEELEYELSSCPDIAQEVLDKLRIQSLADMPKTKYGVSIRRVREIKNAREGIK